MKNVFSIGDRVVVREYEDMLSEYGEIRTGVIKPRGCTAQFNRYMTRFCGEHGVVTGVIPNYKGTKFTKLIVDFDDDDNRYYANDWVFLDYMFELETPIDFDTPDVQDLYT